MFFLTIIAYFLFAFQRYLIVTNGKEKNFHKGCIAIRHIPIPQLCEWDKK